MEITVELHEYFASQTSLELTPGKDTKIILSSRAKVSELLQYLGLPREYVGLIIVNHTQASTDTILSNGDQVLLFPLLNGG